MTQPAPLLDGLLFIAFFTAVTITGVLFGRYMAHVFSGGDYSRGIPGGALEARLFRFIGTSAGEEEDWMGYAREMLIFNGIGFIALLALLLLQGYLPLNPEGFGAFDPPGTRSTRRRASSPTPTTRYMQERPPRVT